MLTALVLQEDLKGLADMRAVLAQGNLLLNFIQKNDPFGLDRLGHVILEFALRDRAFALRIFKGKGRIKAHPLHHIEGFLEFGVGPRAVGMGKAFTAIANDATAMYWNVAGLDLLTENEVSFSYMDWIADMDLMYAALVLKAGSAGTFGLSITSAGLLNRSTRPSPSKSTAYFAQLEGMNWGMPMAPA